MMQLNLHLPQDVASILQCYGDMSEVINKVLALGENKEINLLDKPPVGPVEKYTRFVVTIDNEYYEELVYQYGATSQRISLKRLLCWFVDTNGPERFGWTASTTYYNRRREQLRTVLLTCESSLRRQMREFPEYADSIKEICSKLSVLAREI